MTVAPICLGCGRDHAPGRGCGYERQITWTPYPLRERLRHVRLFPVVAGVAAAIFTVALLIHPPEQELFFYGGVGIAGAMAIVVGGLGTVRLVQELRKIRWRVASVDGRDRALVVLVGGKVRYAFGEAQIYASPTEITWAAALTSRSALGMGAALREPLDPQWRDWLRAEAQSTALLTDDEDPDEGLALIMTATLFGLAARGELRLRVGRYHSWGRGGAKLEDVTEGTELAVDGPAEDEGLPELERRLLAACRAIDDEPVPVDEIVAALDRDSARPAFLARLRDEEPPSSAECEDAAEAWRRLVDEEPELVMRMVEQALLARRPDPDHGNVKSTPLP